MLITNWATGRGRLLRSLVPVAALLACTTVRANDYINRPRVVLDQARYPQFSFVGRLEREYVDDGVKLRESGTAVIVSPCYVVTNFHVAFPEGNTFSDKIFSPDPSTHVMIFRAGLGKDDAGFAGHTMAKPVLWGRPDRLGRGDWVIARLANCIGSLAKYGWANSTSRTQEDLFSGSASWDGAQGVSSLFSIGYAGGELRNQQFYSTGSMRGIDPRSTMLQFDGSLAPGQSGGGVFQIERSRDGIEQVVLCALTTGGLTIGKDATDVFDDWAPEHSNLVMGAFEILNVPEVKELIDRDKAEFGRPNPSGERLKMALPALP